MIEPLKENDQHRSCAQKTSSSYVGIASAAEGLVGARNACIDQRERGAFEPDETVVDTAGR